jgi:hypothetical protein
MNAAVETAAAMSKPAKNPKPYHPAMKHNGAKPIVGKKNNLKPGESSFSLVSLIALPTSDFSAIFAPSVGSLPTCGSEGHPSLPI